MQLSRRHNSSGHDVVNRRANRLLTSTKSTKEGKQVAENTQLQKYGDPETVRRNAQFGGHELPNHLVGEETVRERIMTGHSQRPEYRDTDEIKRRIREGDHA